MKTHPCKLAALLLLSACCFTHAAIYAATMASQPWVTSRIAEAEARTDAKIIAATNAVPAPGDYATVSNRAMSALQSHQPLTPATNYTDSAVSALGSALRGTIAESAQASTNYTDAVAAEFSDGTRTVSYSETSGFANTAGSLIGDGTTYNATDLIRESTNAAIAVAASKQDALPYPTNAIPYAAISGTPSLSGYATREQVAESAVAATNYTDGAISTNNAAFVAAVTNCPLVIASTNQVGGVKVDGTSVTITDGAISSHIDPLNKMWELRLSDSGGATAKVVGRIIGVSGNTAVVYCQLKDTSDIEWTSYLSFYLFSMIIEFNSDAYTAISGVTDGSSFTDTIATLYFADAYSIMNGDKPNTTEIEYSTVVFKNVTASN